METYSYVCPSCNTQCLIEFSSEEVNKLHKKTPCDCTCSHCNSTVRVGILTPEEYSESNEDEYETLCENEHENICEDLYKHKHTEKAEETIEEDVKEYEEEIAQEYGEPNNEYENNEYEHNTYENTEEDHIEYREEQPEEDTDKELHWICRHCAHKNITTFTKQETEELKQGDIFEVSCNHCKYDNDLEEDNLF